MENKNEIAWDWIDKYLLKLLKALKESVPPSCIASLTYTIDTSVMSITEKSQITFSQRINALETFTAMLSFVEHEWIRKHISDISAMCKNSIEQPIDGIFKQLVIKLLIIMFRKLTTSKEDVTMLLSNVLPSLCQQFRAMMPSDVVADMIVEMVMTYPTLMRTYSTDISSAITSVMSHAIAPNVQSIDNVLSAGSGGNTPSGKVCTAYLAVLLYITEFRVESTLTLTDTSIKWRIICNDIISSIHKVIDDATTVLAITDDKLPVTSIATSRGLVSLDFNDISMIPTTQYVSVVLRRLDVLLTMMSRCITFPWRVQSKPIALPLPFDCESMLSVPLRLICLKTSYQKKYTESVVHCIRRVNQCGWLMIQDVLHFLDEKSLVHLKIVASVMYQEASYLIPACPFVDSEGAKIVVPSHEMVMSVTDALTMVTNIGGAALMTDMSLMCHVHERCLDWLKAACLDFERYSATLGVVSITGEKSKKKKREHTEIEQETTGNIVRVWDVMHGDCLIALSDLLGAIVLNCFSFAPKSLYFEMVAAMARFASIMISRCSYNGGVGVVTSSYDSMLKQLDTQTDDVRAVHALIDDDGVSYSNDSFLFPALLAPSRYGDAMHRVISRLNNVISHVPMPERILNYVLHDVYQPGINSNDTRIVEYARTGMSSMMSVMHPQRPYSTSVRYDDGMTPSTLVLLRPRYEIEQVPETVSSLPPPPSSSSAPVVSSVQTRSKTVVPKATPVKRGKKQASVAAVQPAHIDDDDQELPDIVM